MFGGADPAMVLDKLKITLQMIKFEHTVFALPFALIATLLASAGLPSVTQALWIVVAMVGARSAAMTFNRIVDVEYDRTNPRTSNRALVTGTLSMGFAIAFTLIMSALFVFASAMLNPLCLALSLPVLVVLLSYSYFKRFTSLSHLMLGFAIGLAPVGAWLAIRGEPAIPPFLLGIAVMCWISGFDVIYACQDREFDQRSRLYSIPASWGLTRALRVSSALHVITIGVLLSVAAISDLGALSYIGIAITAGILWWEHRIVSPDDLSRVDMAFFNLNGYVSLLLLAAFATDILLV
jgi:4-hydroxybenzoate polyprenyltransferase